MRDSSLRLAVDEPATVDALFRSGQDAERAGRRADARAQYERGLTLLCPGDASIAALLMRRIAFTYQTAASVTPRTFSRFSSGGVAISRLPSTCTLPRARARAVAATRASRP